MDVVREVLDKPVVDRNGREAGRVDGLIVTQREGEPPRLAEVVLGPTALGYRLHSTIGRGVAALREVLGTDREPLHIPFEEVQVGEKVTIGRTVGETSGGVVEQRLRAWLANIPGGR